MAGQDYGGALECLLIDDCGPDRSAEIAAEFIKSYRGAVAFRLMRQSSNLGSSVARNRALEEARGDYVLFVDADDKLFPHSLSALCSHVMSHPGVDLVLGDLTDSNPSMIHPRYPRDYFEGDECKRLLLAGNFQHGPWNKLIRRKLIEDVGLRFPPGFFAQDYIFKFYLAKHIRTMALDYTGTYFYRTDNPLSVSVGASRLKQIADVLRADNTLITDLDSVDLGAQLYYLFYELFFIESDIRCSKYPDATERRQLLDELRNVNRRLSQAIPCHLPALKSASKLLDMIIRLNPSGNSRPYWWSRGVVNRLLKYVQKSILNLSPSH